jgi:hypothetical protein
MMGAGGFALMLDTAGEGQRRLATIAAVFWFEVVGVLALGSMLVMSPLSCFGDPAPGYEGPGPCPDGVPALFRAGSLAVWALTLAGTAGVCLVAWSLSRDHPLLRALAFSVIGLVAVVPIVIVAIHGGVFAVLPFLWTGIPALLLLGSWLPVLIREQRG